MSGTANGAWLNPQARQQLYHFLAAAFLRPLTPGALRHLTDPGVLQELAVLLGEESIADLTGFSASIRGEADGERLQQEFMDLFAVPAGRYVTPFEDVYRGASAERKLGPLLGEHAVAVKRLYRAAGADMDGSCKELPTHVGVELAFMSFLCAREREATLPKVDFAANEHDTFRVEPCTYYRTLQLRFLREHLNAWFPQLGRAIREKAASGVYRSLAGMTEALLQRDAAWLASLPASVVATPAAVQ